MMDVTTAAGFPAEIVNPEGLNFKAYILSKMKTVRGSDGRRTLTVAELSDALGLSTKVFQEILNGRRSGPDRRDLIIALCAELGLDADETDEALRLFPGALRPLSRHDERDRVISDFLNAGFDVRISYAELDRQLRKQNLPVLKIRYRSQTPDDGWRRNGMNKNKINWALRSEEERQRYNYYTSLNYDDKTATVLALFTSGDKEIPQFKIQEAYEAFLAGKPYPPRPEPGPKSTPLCFYQELPELNDLDELYSITDLDLDSDIRALSLEPDESVEESNEGDGSSNIYQQINAPAPKLSGSDKSFSMPRPRARLSRTKKLRDFFVDANDELDTDEYQPIEEKDFRNAMRELSSTFRMTTNTASAGIVLNQLRSRRGIDKSMVRIEEMLNYFRYKAEKPTDRMFWIDTELKDQENGNKLLYIHVQGKEAVRDRQNIVVVLDVSGSMSDNNVQTQAAIATIVSKLKPGDTFSLITYSNKDHTVIDGLPILAKEDLTVILEKLLGLEINGCTDGSAGIETAYTIGKRNYKPDGNNQVILITDGDLNFGITSRGGLEGLIEEKKKSNLFLSVIGTGLTNYKDDKLETLCKHGNGVYRVVNNLNDVKRSIRDDYASLVNIIAKDVKAQVEFNPEIVESYRLLGFENRELKHEDFTNDKVISEPFGSGGYGIALYELTMQKAAEQQTGGSRYTKVVTTGSRELGIVKIRYKEPLEDVSHEIEYVIHDPEENCSDNLLLAHAVYVCAEKLRNSDKISQRDEAIAKMNLENLGTELQVMNLDDLPKLHEILRRSKDQLNIRNYRDRYFPF